MGTIEVEGRTIFSRKAGQPGNPKLVLLRGFQKASARERVPRLVCSRRSALAVGYGFDAAAHPFQEVRVRYNPAAG
jgi:hypothetical protein